MGFKRLMLGLSVLFACTGEVLANDNYPDKAVSLVVVWPAGGGHDIAARLVAEHAADHLGQPIMVNNVTGAAGSNGMRHVASAKPDGYTVGLMGMHALVQSYMNPNAPSLDKFDPLAFLAFEPGSLQVRADAGIDTLEQYVEQLRREPGSIVHGNDALGGNTFVYTTLLEKHFGIELTRVPYAGHAPNTAALVSGEIASAAMPIPQIVQHYQAGTVKVLGVMGEERNFMLPDVPTFRELGHDLVIGDYFVFFMPKGVPAEARAKLEDAFLKAMDAPALRERAATIGIEVQPGGQARAAAVLAEQDAKIYPMLLEEGMVHKSLVK